MPEDKWGFNGWAKSYDQDVTKAARSDDWMFKDYDHILDKVIDYCELASNRYSAVLDIGIGTGNLTSRFIGKVINIIGIDTSREMLAMCRQKYPAVELRIGDFLKIPLPPQSVDLVVSSYAFHHLTPVEKEESILEMRRVLKPKGRVVLTDLMFKDSSQEQHIKQALRESGRGDVVDEIDEEYPALFADLEKTFRREGYIFRGEQLTDSVWILCAQLR
jgi:putative AdoMet-dependent methyltransferase